MADAPQRRSGRRRTLAAARFLAASVGIHVVALVLFGSTVGAPPDSLPRVEVLEVQPYVPDPPRAERVARSPARSATVVARASAALSATRPPPVHPRRRERPGAGAAPPALSLSMRPRVLDLNVRPPWLDEPPPAPRTAKAPRAPEDSARSVKRRLDEVLAQDAAARRVAGGRAHPVLFDLLRDAEQAFAPNWSMVEGSPRRLGTMSETARVVVRSMARSYLDGIRQFMGTGTPLPGDRDADEPGMLRGYAEVIERAERDATGLQCVLCVDLDPDGKSGSAVTVLRRSGLRAFDAEARRALEVAARVRPLPPDAPAVLACYRFVAGYFRVPPLPTVLCRFDEAVPSIDCYYPGKRVLQKKIVLESVRLTDQP